MQDYFQKHFPRAVERFGPPLLFAGVPNHDTFAFSLAESTARVVFYHPENCFYFWDRERSAYVQVQPEERLMVFIRGILRRSLDGLKPELARAIWMLWNERELGRVVAVAKILLGVDESFFRGDHGAKRMVGGAVISPHQAPSYSLFAEESVEARDGCILTASEAYHGYWTFCQPRKFTPVHRKDFRKCFTNETLTRWGVGMRHDLAVPRANDDKPKIVQGWQGLGLRTGTDWN